MKERWRPSPRDIGGVMMVLAFLVPYGYLIPPRAEITSGLFFAMTYIWEVNTPAPIDFYNPFVPLIQSLFWAGLRLLFVVMVYRLYKGNTTIRRTIIVGLIGELQPAIVLDLPLFILTLVNPSAVPVVTYVLPVPILLLLGVILIRVLSPPKPPSTWKDGDDTKHWWEERIRSSNAFLPKFKRTVE
ncbi:MAG: hypothetical protein ACXABZ_07130 [Candidatus Thorarchaeota archaeon]|jgi:hypothetical protein